MDEPLLVDEPLLLHLGVNWDKVWVGFLEVPIPVITFSLVGNFIELFSTLIILLYSSSVVTPDTERPRVVDLFFIVVF